MQHAQNTLLPPTYEFTKRKRWADLLITEPADTITFVLTLSCTILFCSPAVTELLGWKDTDLIDCDLVDLIICATTSLNLFVSDAGEALADDQAVFRTTFEESVRNKSELLSYVRLQCNGNRLSYSHTEDALFEIRGYLPECEAEGGYFFAVAKPYPSRNVAM
jgi:PAS domain-containing protein